MSNALFCWVMGRPAKSALVPFEFGAGSTPRTDSICIVATATAVCSLSTFDDVTIALDTRRAENRPTIVRIVIATRTSTSEKPSWERGRAGGLPRRRFAYRIGST